MRFSHTIILFLPLCLALAGRAEAAGFALQEQSVRNQGASFAGAGANPGDASTIFYNPAGMTELDGPQGVAGVSIVMPRQQFTDRGSTAGLTAGGPGAQAAYAGGNGGNPFPRKGLPNFYAAAPVDGGKYWIGLGVITPFGLADEYDRSAFGRYDSLSSELTVVDIAPVVAFKINDALSVGGGPDLQVATGQLDNALPCPSAGVACGAVFSPSSDGLSRLTGESWHIGYNLGALWKVNAETQVGVHYRAANTHNVKGTVLVAGLGGGLAGLNGRRDAAAELKLPPGAGVSAAYAATPRLKILGSVEWTGWNSFDEIRVTFPLPIADSTARENYADSWAGAVGAEWRQTDSLTLRGGVQVEMTPTTSPDRSTRTPDSDRTWLSAGLSYALGPSLTVDAAYSHLFMRDADIGLTKTFYSGGAASTVHINGTSRNSADIASVQLSFRF